MSQTKKPCEPLVAVWLRPSTTEPCICCKQVAEKPRGEHLKNDVWCIYFHNSNTTKHFRRTSTTFRSVEKAGVRCNELQWAVFLPRGRLRHVLPTPLSPPTPSGLWQTYACAGAEDASGQDNCGLLCDTGGRYVHNTWGWARSRSHGGSWRLLSHTSVSFLRTGH